ncbi:MAG: hypothetical protein RMJ98_15375 [Myxococcales bacterium]|nr:hypothetical protein [Polyangiaceae bacterium]MDW8250675.1 hypothetical protein [Myxococcales bacterium]
MARTLAGLVLGMGTPMLHPSERRTETTSTALALWLQTRIKHFKHGMERDLDCSFTFNLLPAKS